MTQRGQALFDRYASNHLDHSTLNLLTMAHHAFNLTVTANDALVPPSEIIEEVGPLIAALGIARLIKVPLITADLANP